MFSRKMKHKYAYTLARAGLSKLSSGAGRGLSQKTPPSDVYTFNDAAIHVDFMMGTPDMSIVGIDKEGKEHPILVDGDFAI